MKFFLEKPTQEFIGKYFGDLSKAIVTVGLASYFFERMPLMMRIVCGVLALVFFTVSIILVNISNKGGK